MPNEKVKYFKYNDIIKDKIIYVKDKALLGFESANIQAFLFNLYKMKNFDISNNFIYMEDDYFFGRRLKKSDFFYFDKKERKVLPYLVTTKFFKIYKDEVYKNYYSLYKDKEIIHPHSSKGFWLGFYNTEKFFLEHNENQIISTEFTHNAIPENIVELEEIFNIAKKYKFFNEMIFSKERYILTLIHQHFINLYQMNIKQKKVHSIMYKYISIEKINKFELNSPLFVINTGGNHIPLRRQYKMQKKIMKKKFPFPCKYEILNSKKNILNEIYEKNYLFLLNFFLIIIIIKIFNYII